MTESAEYKECLQVLGFLSKEELLLKLDAMTNIIETSEANFLEDFKLNLKVHRETIKNASLEMSHEPTEVIDANEKLNRIQLKEVSNNLQWSTLS